MAKIVFAVIVAALAVAAVQAQNQADASAFCGTCSGRRNTRDHYAHPTDCHKYYQCFFHDDGKVSGIERTCAQGTFFNERYLACGPEGPAGCSDVCLSEPARTRGWAAVAGSCSQYVACSTSSNVMCCPANTRFNENTGNCDDDETCTDACTQLSPAVPTSVAPPAFVNSTHCVDSFGNLLGAVSGRSDVFLVYDNDAVVQRPCATGSTFSLTECTCATAVEVDRNTQPSNRLCSHYMPFDVDFGDYSSKKNTNFAYGEASISTQFSANGGGSLLVNGGRVEIPGAKTLDLQHHGSFCFFYRCPNGVCPTGGILSNNNNDQKTSYSAIFASTANNNFRGHLKLQRPEQEVEVTAQVSNDGFNQVCVILDTAENGPGVVRTYVNNQLVSTTSLTSGWFVPAGCPFTIGTDQIYGNFNGYIDEVLICRRAISASDVDAHFNGQDELRAAGLIP